MSQPLFRPSPIPTRRAPKSLVRFSEKRDQSVIARHIRNIYKEEELEEEGTYAKFAYMGHDGLQLYEVRAHGDRHAVTLCDAHQTLS